MSIEPQKLIDTLTARHAQKISQLEKEIAFLLVSNAQLTEENERLKRPAEDSDEED